MEIETVRHKALRRFIETGKPKGLNSDVAGRLLKMIAYLTSIATVEELGFPPNWGAHELSGDRAGTWSLTVTKNWRMTFRVTTEGAIADLDLEDYH